MRRRTLAGVATLVALAQPVSAAQEPSKVTTAVAPADATASDTDAEPVQEFVVVGRAEELIGIAGNASDGTVGPAELRKRAYSRPAEVMETVPGVIVTQHSGSGKANQYFLRGFNLDHGTDFTVSVDGIPVNMPTHAHGQGYLDLNWLSPELIDRIDYRKGPYHSEVGDFASAGSASMKLVSALDAPIVQLTLGQHEYGRVLVADSAKVGRDLNLVWAVDANTYDGPWLFSEDSQRASGMVRLSGGDKAKGWDVTGIAYGAAWSSTDQAPRRAVNAGLLSRLDSVDHTDGGKTARDSIALRHWWDTKAGRTEASAYYLKYRLDLFSNFTYFLDDPDNGDQFGQIDRRAQMGGAVDHRWSAPLGHATVNHHVGASVRRDDIGRVQLDRRKARNLLSITKQDAVDERNAGIFYQNEIKWTDKLRSFLGVRGNRFEFDVDGVVPAPGRVTKDAGIATPHVGLAYQLAKNVELYAHAGDGFHSNDARGVVAAIDPVPALVRTQGRELGTRIEPVKGYQLTLTGWELEVASELVFVGDAGTTEPSRPSKRRGIELANYYRLRRDITLYGDLSLSSARFSDSDPAGDEIPNSIERVISAGVNVDRGQNFGSLSLRHFGGRPLIEDNSSRSQPTTVVNLQLGRRAAKTIWTFDLLNLLDSKDDDITYFYTSRLPGEPAEGVNDQHFHPVVPREARLTMRMRF